MTSKTIDSITSHYEPATDELGLVAKVSQLLKEYGSETLTTDKLSNLDQLHVRGMTATKELAELACLRAGYRVLDAGCGMGGPARFLAEAYGVTVMGVDLTPSFIEVARMLTEHTALVDSVQFQVGDLASLSFVDESFDLVWTQHVVMNIKDRQRVYRELARVLKSEGQFVFYDVIAADDKPQAFYPTPWAATEETSFLLNEAETVEALSQGGLKLTEWKDVTEEALGWFARLAAQKPSPQAISLPAVVGPRFVEMTANFGRNLQEGRVRLTMGVTRRAHP